MVRFTLAADTQTTFPSAESSGAMRPPETHREEASYELNGVVIEDPYLWLEESTVEVDEWVTVQNEYAEQVLASIEVSDDFTNRFDAIADSVEFEPIDPTGGGYFDRVRQPDEERAVLYHRESLEEDRRCLVDPNDFDPNVSLSWYRPSPDGQYVAYGIDESGRENYDVHVLETSTGKQVDELTSLGRTNLRRGAWKDNGFYYTATGEADDDSQLEKELRYHEIGTDSTEDLCLRSEFDDQVWPSVETDPATDTVIIGLTTWDETDLYRLDHSAVDTANRTGGDVDLEPVIVGTEAMFYPNLIGDSLYVRTTLHAPNGRVSRLDLQTGERGEDALEPVISEDEDAILEGIGVTPRRLFIIRSREVTAEIDIHDRHGNFVTDVDLPGSGSVEAMRPHRSRDALFLTYEGFDQPRSVCRISGTGQRNVIRSDRASPRHPNGGFNDGGGNPETDTNQSGRFEIVDQPDVAIGAELTVDQEWFESADGTEIPMFVVRRSDIEPTGTNPAVLSGYGGFNVSLTPSFHRYTIPFIVDGGVFAVANVRGGGEFGEKWHHAARRSTKERTFEDFEAAARSLIDSGWTSADRLACRGGSNGGLTVGAAMTRSPDLFAAALCNVPLLDMLRFHTSLLGASWTGEYGDPTDPEDFEWLRSYSPYHQVEDRSYPDVLFTTATEDTRVDPFHARKMTARLQYHARDTVVLLRTYESTGHGTGKPVSQIVDEQLDRWKFLYDRLGIDSTESSNHDPE